MDSGEDSLPGSFHSSEATGGGGLVAVSDDDHEDLNEYEDYSDDSSQLPSMDGQQRQRVRPLTQQIGIAPAQKPREAPAKRRRERKKNQQQQQQQQQNQQKKKKQPMKQNQQKPKQPFRKAPPPRFDANSPGPSMSYGPPPVPLMALAPPYVDPGPSLSDMVPPHVLAAIHFSRPPEITAKVEERKQIREKMNLSKKEAMDRLRRYVEENPGTNPIDDIPGINDGLSKRQRLAAMNNIRGPIPAKEGCVLLYPPPFTDVRTLTHLDLLPRHPHSWGKLRLFTLLNKLRGIPFEQLTLQHCETMHQLAVLAHAKLDAPIRSLRKRLLAPPPPPVEEKDLPPSCVLMHPPPFTDPNDVTPDELEGTHVINEWPFEKKYEVLNKLRSIPHHLLTLEHSLSIFRIAKRLKVKLEETLVQRTDKIFLDDKVAKYLENYRAEAAAAEAEGNKLSEEELMKRALAAAAAGKRKVLPSVPKKQKFDYIPDFYADCNDFKKFDQQRKWVLFNAMRAIPLEELDRQACHKIAMLGSHMKVALSAAFHQRREELIGKKLIPVGPTCSPVAAPGFLPPHQIATPSLPLQIGPVQPPKPKPPPLPEAPPGQHPPVSFQDVVNAERSRVEDPVAEWNQPRDWNRPQSANGQWNQGFGQDVDLRRPPQRPYYEEPRQATKFAYASAMAALCYMMIVPYHLYLILKNSGPEYVDVILRACKPRIRNMIAVSREPVFGPLATYKGGLQEVPDYIGDIWGTFINKMRHSGMEYWDCNIIPIPRHMTGFTGTDMAPVPGEISTFDDADFRRTFACSRFIQSPAEKGIIPPQNLQSWLDSPYSYELKHKNPLVNAKNFDPIVHLPFRDLLYNYGIGSRTTPMFTLFFLKLIGARWNRNLAVKHQLEIDIKEGKERWKHVVTLSFEGVPAVFLGGRCRRDTFASALIHAGGIVAEQLSNLMIIPQELCYFVQKQARTWGSIVIYVCRERFAAFEALVRNPMYTKLHSVPSATLDFKNPLYKLAESFFWRMRSTGYPYWVDHRTRLMVPVSFGQKPQLPEDAFFSFDSIYQQPTWESINATVDRIDYFEMSVLKIEDRMWTVWEGGERGQEMVKHIAPVTPPQPPQQAQTTVSPGIWFENALSSEYNIPLTALSFADCTMVLKLLRCLAAASCEKGLELKITKSLAPTGHELFHCNVAWSGMLSWILKASFDSYLERDIEFGAAWELYRLLVKMAIVPPGLFEFVVNNETRLPYVVSSLVPFLRLLESCLPQFTENSHGLLMEQMKRLALVEWLSRKIQLPPQLIPNSEEQRRLPFVLVEEMSPRTQEIWDATYGQELLGAAKPVEEPRQPVIHQVAYQPQPEYHANSHFTPPMNVVENYASQGMPPPERRRYPVVQKTAAPEPAAPQLPPREDPPAMGSWMPVLQAPRPIKQAVVPQEVEKAPVAPEDRVIVSVKEAEPQKPPSDPSTSAPEPNPILDPPAPPVFAPEPTPEDERIFMTPTFVPMKKPAVEEESMEEEANFYSSVEGPPQEPQEAPKETLSFEDDKMEENFEDETLTVEPSTFSESDVIVLQPPVPQEVFSHKIDVEMEENYEFLQSQGMSSESAPQDSTAPPDASASGYHNFDSGDDDGEDEYL